MIKIQKQYGSFWTNKVFRCSNCMAPCYGYSDEQPCQIPSMDEEGIDFCACHYKMYVMSMVVKKQHEFFDVPKIYKTEYRYKLKYITQYRYFSQMYHMEKYIESKLKRFRNFFEVVCIQRCFRRAMSNPEYKMCRNRLMNEFKHLESN